MFDNSVVEIIKGLSIYGLTIVALTSFVKTGLQKLLKTSANWTGYVASVLKELAAMAEGAGVTLLVETNGVYADTARLAALLDQVSSPAVAR